MNGVAQYEFRLLIGEHWEPDHGGHHPLGKCNDDDYFTVLGSTDDRVIKWVNAKYGIGSWWSCYDMSDGEEEAEFKRYVHGDNIATVDLIAGTIWRRDTGEKVDL